MNGFEGSLSADALGIAACLFAYSHLSFDGGDFAELMAEHYRCLHDFVLAHSEAARQRGSEHLGCDRLRDSNGAAG